MKRNHLAMALGVVMCASLLGGCASNSSTSSKTTDSGTVYGEVSEVDDDGITIEVGTKKEMSDAQKDDSSDSSSSDSKSDSTDSKSNSTDSSSSDNKNSSTDKQEAPSIIEKTEEQGQPPEKPDDSNSSNSSDSKSTDNNQQGQPPEKPDDSNNSNSSGSSDSKNSSNSSDSNNGSDNKSTEDISLSDISEGDIVEVSFDDSGKVEKINVIMSANNNGAPSAQGGEQTQAPSSYSAVKEYKSDTSKSNLSVKSTGTDENAVHAYKGAKVTLKNATITRNSKKSKGGDSSSFYGTGAAVLESEGTLKISNSNITTNAKGGAGIFAYGKGTVYTSNTQIRTSQDTSGGIHAAGGRTLYAWDMDVQTKGESSAAIRSDRGGGKMVVDGGTYTSKGTGSPAVYSTADIAINNVKLTATKSEAVCIEGLNSLRLFNSNLTGNMSDNKQNDCTWNVILYQSMSGDSEEGNSTFEMNGGTLTAKNGGMFYTTNTESTITLSDVNIKYAKDNDFFLKCTGNKNQRGWGTSGKNGADCLFTAIKQEMKGDVIWDSISKLDFYMTAGSTLTGAVKDDESCAGDGGSGYCNMYIEKGSTWTVTGNSTVTKLQNAGTIQDASGKKVTIKGTDGTVYVKGTSKYTVTVESYKTTVNTSGASKETSWSDYKQTKPSGL